MLLRILRPIFWQLDARFRATHNGLKSLVLLVVLVGGQWLYSRMLIPYFTELTTNEVYMLVGGILVGGLFLMFLISVLDMAHILYQLYFSAELEMLMVAPIPHSAIFTAKLLQCSRAAWMIGLPLTLLLVALGLIRGADGLFFIAVLFWSIASIFLVTSTAMIIVMLVSSLVGSRFLHSSIIFIFFGSTLLILFLQQSISQLWATEWARMASESITQLSPSTLSLMIAAFYGLAVLSILSGYAIFRAVFYQGFDKHRIQISVPKRSEATAFSYDRGQLALNRLVAWFPTSTRFMILKEWQIVSRDVRAWLSLLQPLALVVAPLGSLLLVQDHNTVTSLRSVFFWFEMIFLGMILGLSYNGLPRFVLLYEGRNISLLRLAPIQMGMILHAKYWASLIPTVITWAGTLLVMALIFGFSAEQIGIFMFVIMWGLPIITMIAISLGGLSAQFSSVMPEGRLSFVGEAKTLMLSIAFSCSQVALVIWFIARTYPESDMMRVLHVMGLSTPTASHIAIPLVAIACQLLILIATLIAWHRVVDKLSNWQENT